MAAARWRLQVSCPAHMVTGGPEALHQLVHAARRQGADARIVYTGRQPGRDPTAEPFRIYDIEVDERLDDSPGCTVVVPETATQLLTRLRRARPAIWWLSVDNHFVTAESALADWRRHWWKRWSGRVARPFDVRQPDPRVWHFAQSAYARDFLSQHRLAPVLMLTDHLREDFLVQARAGASTLRREPRRVAYNPKKGLDATRAVIAAAAGRFEFVPIEGMTPAQVLELLCSSGVYIDFGHHPGRDRIPREAAACGCRVLTGRRGAAANAVDLPIPDAFKLDEAAPSFAEAAVAALERLVDAGQVDTADSDLAAFTAWRQTILDQQRLFDAEVRALLAALREAG